MNFQYVDHLTEAIENEMETDLIHYETEHGIDVNYGFTVEFIRKNHKNPQLTKTFFIKYFDDEIQTQGLKALPTV